MLASLLSQESHQIIMWLGTPETSPNYHSKQNKVSKCVWTEPLFSKNELKSSNNKRNPNYCVMPDDCQFEIVYLETTILLLKQHIMN